MTRLRRPGPSARSRLPATSLCQICNIGIFANRYEAAQRGVPFDSLVNLRVGNHCIGCAGSDSMRLEQMADLETICKTKQPNGCKEIDMANNEIYVKFEAKVEPPPIIGRPGKWSGVEARVISTQPDGRAKSGDWMRFLFNEAKQAKLAGTHLRKRAREIWLPKHGWNIKTQIVPNGEGAYLYVQWLKPS